MIRSAKPSRMMLVTGWPSNSSWWQPNSFSAWRIRRAIYPCWSPPPIASGAASKSVPGRPGSRLSEAFCSPLLLGPPLPVSPSARAAVPLGKFRLLANLAGGKRVPAEVCDGNVKTLWTSGG